MTNAEMFLKEWRRNIKLTNAEKYLKDNVSINELIKEIADYKPKLETSDNVYAKMQEFFDQEATPTLTEDERVILKFIDGEYTHIQRADGLWLIHYEDEYTVHQVSFEMYSHLFQFIKERRRIRDS